LGGNSSKMVSLCVNKQNIILLALFGVCSSGVAVGADFILEQSDFSTTAIVIHKESDSIKRFAAIELQKHLRLITGHDFVIVDEIGKTNKAFMVGIKPESDEEPLGDEEARYLVTENAVYLYGDDQIRRRRRNHQDNALDSKRNRAGTLFAVYNFLENEMNVHWIEPGDQGIAYQPMRKIRIEAKADRWSPYFPYQRGLRISSWKNVGREGVQYRFLPEGFRMTEEQAEAKRVDLYVWLRRMRMGTSNYLQFGHAFTSWWEKYGETHPEYFALNGKGFRGPVEPSKPDRVKMCVSNPGLVKQIVQNWLERRKDNPNARTLNVCVNDGGGRGADEFCHDEGCLALDVPLEGEAPLEHLTDRYMHLANEVLKEARKYVPDAEVTAYAYSRTRRPPRKVHLLDGVVLQFVTGMSAPFSETSELYQEWKRQGATKFLFRPNDLCVELGLPLGHDKRIFDHQQLAVKYGAKGTDHDSIYGFWTGISGITYYVLAKSTADPSRSFEYWEDEYISVYGAAQPDVKAYFKHWRDKFEKAILPANISLHKEGKRGFLSWHKLGRMSRTIRDYYSKKDFDTTDEMLKRALSRELNPLEMERVERLVLANKHNRLTFEAMVAVNEGNEETILKKAKKLLDFRVRNREKFRMNWWMLFYEQDAMGDATGITSLLLQSRLVDRKSFNCIRATESPVIDGKLDESFWTQANTGMGFLENGDAVPVNVDTSTFVAYDDENLYIGFECHEPQMDDLVERVRKRDGSAWKDNAVEIFLDPQNTREEFYQFVITSAGALLDGRKIGEKEFDVSWNVTIGSDIEYKIQKGVESWTIECRISFGVIGMSTPQPGDSIRFNLVRDRTLSGGVDEMSALAPTLGKLHASRKFTKMVFR